MSSAKRKKALLVALSMVMIYVLWRQLSPVVTGLASGSGALSMARRSNQDGGRAALDLPDVVDLRLDDLEKETEQFSAERDPFRFGFVKKPSPPPPPGDSESAMRRALREAKEREQKEAEPPRPPERQPPQIDVSFL